MKRDLKITKDTVVNSIVSEMSDKLEVEVSDEEKRKEMMVLTQSKLDTILKSFSDRELLPERDFTSQQESEQHILKIVKKVRKRLLVEMEKEN